MVLNKNVFVVLIPHMNSNKASLLLLGAALFWGFSFVFQSISSSLIGSFTFNCLRFALGGLALIPVIMILQKKGIVDKSKLKISLIGGVCCGLAISAASVVQQIGIGLTSAGKGGFLTALYIIIVPFLSILLGKKLSKSVVIAALFALVGLYFISIKTGFTLEKGDIYLIICALLFAVHILIIDHFNAKNADGTILSCVQFFVASILTFPGMLLEHPEITLIKQALIPILYAGIMSCAVAYTFQIIGQKYVSATKSSIILSLESVFSALGGALILSERLTGRELFGCALVFLGVILAQYPQKSST